MPQYAAAYGDLTTLVNNLNYAATHSTDEIDKYLKDCGERIAKRMRELVPVRTGRLQSDIRVLASRLRVIAGPTTVPYAAFVEFGTGERGELYNRSYLVSGGRVMVIDAKKASGMRGQKAQPYARPAFSEFLESFGPGAAEIGAAMVMGEKRALAN